MLQQMLTVKGNEPYITLIKALRQTYILSWL